jgi:hypothetical protein
MIDTGVANILVWNRFKPALRLRISNDRRVGSTMKARHTSDCIRTRRD